MSKYRYFYYDGHQLRLHLADTFSKRIGTSPKRMVAYRLRDRDTGKIIFEAADYDPSPFYEDRLSAASARELIGFLCLRPGDTDDEFFEKYTPEQLAWAKQHGENYSMYQAN